MANSHLECGREDSSVGGGETEGKKETIELQWNENLIEIRHELNNDRRSLCACVSTAYVKFSFTWKSREPEIFIPLW